VGHENKRRYEVAITAADDGKTIWFEPKVYWERRELIDKLRGYSGRLGEITSDYAKGLKGEADSAKDKLEKATPDNLQRAISDAQGVLKKGQKFVSLLWELEELSREFGKRTDNSAKEQTTAAVSARQELEKATPNTLHLAILDAQNALANGKRLLLPGELGALSRTLEAVSGEDAKALKAAAESAKDKLEKATPDNLQRTISDAQSVLNQGQTLLEITRGRLGESKQTLLIRAPELRGEPETGHGALGEVTSSGATGSVAPDQKKQIEGVTSQDPGLEKIANFKNEPVKNRPVDLSSSKKKSPAGDSRATLQQTAPIEIGEKYPPDGDSKSFPPLGRISIVSISCGMKNLITAGGESRNNLQYFSYTAAYPSQPRSYSALDMAIIVRGFLLAKIGLLRMAVSEALTRHNGAAHRNGNDNDKSGFNEKVQEYQKLCQEVEHDAHPPSYKWLWFENKAAQCADYLREWIASHRGIAGVTCIVVALAALFWIWEPTSKLGWNSIHTVTSLFLLLVLLTLPLFFLLIASNFEKIGDKIDRRLHEKLQEEIDNIASELAQTNLSTASRHVVEESSISAITPATHYVPEPILRRLDEAMQIRESMNSLSKVLHERQRHVQESVKHLEEHRQRARRAVTAAAGGIFVGYFTYEMGESVLKYVHTAQGADGRSLEYWLFTVPGVHAHLDLQKSGRTDVKTLAELKTDYEMDFHHHELFGQAVLLTVTLIAALLAAWIGWRKPPEEQASGHGGHH